MSLSITAVGKGGLFSVPRKNKASRKDRREWTKTRGGGCWISVGGEKEAEIRGAIVKKEGAE